MCGSCLPCQFIILYIAVEDLRFDLGMRTLNAEFKASSRLDDIFASNTLESEIFRTLQPPEAFLCFCYCGARLQIAL